METDVSASTDDITIGQQVLLAQVPVSDGCMNCKEMNMERGKKHVSI